MNTVVVLHLATAVVVVTVGVVETMVEAVAVAVVEAVGMEAEGEF